MTSKKRLIDANALMGNGWHLVKTGESNRFVASMSLADVPTVDAVEVVHGRWIYVDGKGSHAEYECNQCRVHVCFDEMIDGSIPAYKHCPNCGAKMDKGEKV